LLVLALLVPAVAFAAPVGKFTAVEGNVDLTVPGAAARPVKAGDPVNVGDIVRSKSKSKCELTFGDGNVIRLAENTRIKVTEYLLAQEGRTEKIDLFRGKIRSIVKTAKEASGLSPVKFEVHTPTAVCGVRGTDFFTYFQNGISGAIFQEGSGYGYSANQPQVVTPIVAGQSMVVTSAATPPEVKFVPAVELQKHLNDTTPSGDGGSGDSGGGDGAGGAGSTPLIALLDPGDAGTGDPPGGSTPPPGPEINPNENNLTTDTTAPLLAVTADAAPLTNHRTITYLLASNEPASYQYRLDGGPAQAIAGSTVTFSDLAEGDHTIEFTAIDAAGNTSGPITIQETLDYTAPQVVLNAKAAAPGSGTAKTDVSLALGGSDANGIASYAYQLDSGTTATSTTGAITLSGLEEGAHTVAYYSTDRAGNKSETGTLAFDLNRYPLEGRIANSSGQAYSVSGDIAAVANQDWGSWVIAMNDIAGTLAATTHAGGYSGTDEAPTGYWLDQLTRDPGALSGTSQLTHLSQRSLGTGTGTVTVTTGGGLASLTDRGSNFTETPLTFFSPIEARKISAGDQLLYTLTVPTTGTGRWWDVAVVKTENGSSQLYSIDTLNNRSGYILPNYSYPQTLIGTITAPIYFRLTWGDSPSDLDAHTWVPGGGHVYWGSRGSMSSYPYVYLDQDIVSGYGPEVTSFNQFLSGDSYFSVYQYSSYGTLTASEALVEIYTGTTDITPILNAYFGGTQTLWTPGVAPVPVVLLGRLSASLTDAQVLWNAPLYSFNSTENQDGADSASSQSNTYTTYDGGAYRGYMAGTWIGSDLNASTYALYVAPADNDGVSKAGFLRGSLSGSAYPAILMSSMEGSLVKTEMTADAGVAPEDLCQVIEDETSRSWEIVSAELPDIPVTDGETTGTLTVTSVASNDAWISPSHADWGINETLLKGVSESVPSGNLQDIAWEFSLPSTEEHEYPDATTYLLASALTGSHSEATGGHFLGDLAGAKADWVSAATYVFGGELRGIFNPNQTWQAAALSAWIETAQFFDMASTESGRQALAALNIPAIQVGQANLAGSGNNLTVNMNNVTFFSNVTGGQPRIWATPAVTGSYSGTPTLGAQGAVSLTQSGAGNNASGLAAQFTPIRWDSGKWGAQVTGSGVVNSASIQFQGGAAGTTTPGTGTAGTFNGTGAGTVKQTSGGPN
jgi:hypothetical protein